MAFWHAPPLLPGIANYIWTLPPEARNPVTIDVLRGTIHAKIGTLEESCNVLHYITDPEVAITPAIQATFAAKLALQFAAFMAATPSGISGATAWNNMFSRAASWDEVRAAHVQIDSGVVKWAPGVNTTFEPIVATIGNGEAIPAQVASVVTFHTGVRAGKRGRSGRGRVYMGPMGVPSIAGVTGLFVDGWAAALASAWRTFFITGMEAGAQPFKQVVLSPATNARYLVTDVLCGMVPDTQRRRRKSLLESYATA